MNADLRLMLDNQECAANDAREASYGRLLVASETLHMARLCSSRIPSFDDRALFAAQFGLFSKERRHAHAVDVHHQVLRDMDSLRAARGML